MDPAWYRKLSSNSTNRRYAVGLVFALIFKLLTIPSCGLAAYMTPPEDDVAGLLPPMNAYQQVCWGSRGSTLVLELYHFLSSTELLLHHGMILIAMTFLTLFDSPHRALDLSLGALVSEFPSMTFSFISRLGLAGVYPTLEWMLLVIGAVLTLTVRVPAALLAMAMVPESGMRGGPGLVVQTAVLTFLAYNLNISWRRLKRAKVCVAWQKEGGGWDFGIQITRNFMISSTAFFSGLATMVVQILGLAIYSSFESATRARLIFAAFGSSSFLISTQLRGKWHRWVDSTVCYFSSVASLDMGTIGRWAMGSWIILVALLVSTGEVPRNHNNGMDPRDIVAGAPLFCDLVLSWEFWLCATVTLLLPMAIVQLDMEERKPIDQLKELHGKQASHTTEENPKGSDEEEVPHTPEMQLQW